MARYKWCAKAGAMLVLNEKTGRWNMQRPTKGKPITSVMATAQLTEE